MKIMFWLWFRLPPRSWL